MKITLLIPDVSSNCSIARYTAMAEVLKRHYQLELIGPRFGSEVWEPYQESLRNLPVETVPAGRLKFGWRRVIGALEAKISGDVLYAFKPLMTSFGVALAHQRKTRKPIVLDVDDEDLLWPVFSGIPGAIRQLLFGWLRVDGLYDRLWVHWQRRKASDFLVVSTFLQKRYGGTILHHGCDTNVFDPTRYDKRQLRREFGLSEDQKLILFTGTALRHKGLEEIVTAIENLGIPELRFLFVGGSPNRSYYEELLRRGGDLIMPMGHQSHELMPKFLACADYVVLPQQGSRLASAQVPAKLYEAMAMAKPVIGTAVGDLPQLLGDGCGLVVPPGDQGALEKALRYVYEHPAEAGQMGKQARERAEALFSYDAMEKILLDVFRKFE